MVGFIDHGPMYSPYLTTFSDESVRRKSAGVVMYVREETCMGEQVPYARFPRIPRHREKSKGVEELGDVALPA